ncbi:LysR family transcriptional regulator [Microbulbifer agarilyticus]|uniref:LysR family transcriptional regulator n=1 Tax=Microbulbifer agarilyticus TaxID=260552 RepID=UPI001C94C2F6|nr:LysR family transcriptional regulator [Microbulbifer agarilyticus]MBY6209931.1 LysR family transcriptional regulator [Microbulbifer agarilyticus]MCA0894734.1 LysR family transcriptional regulator [Microbulbifer agarilyticus]
MTDLNDMMVFRAVVDQGSFTGAATELGLPKSNISRKVSRLEESLGARLLERSTRALHLTEVGRLYYEHCVRIAEEISSAEQVIEAHSAQPKGWIRLCTSVTLGQTLISPLLPSFREQYSEVQLNMMLTNRRVDIIEEGFDLAIRAGESPDSNLVSRRLYTASLNLYASPQYLEATKNHKITQPADLHQHRCLHMNANSEHARWQLSNGDKEYTFEYEPEMRCNDFSSIQQQVINGAGISLLPDYLCQQAAYAGTLVQVLPGWTGKSVSVYGIFPSRKGASPKIRAFLDYLHEVLRHQHA